MKVLQAPAGGRGGACLLGGLGHTGAVVSQQREQVVLAGGLKDLIAFDEPESRGAVVR